MSMDPHSPAEGASNRRQRLKPWLKAQINSNQYPGLYWEDKEQGIFHIKWKHSGRADWKEEDGLIFKAWAIHTGRFREGIDEPDYPGWKTRLRCALNKMKPDIQELKDRGCSNEPNPYRVYQFLDKKGSLLSSPPQEYSLQPVAEYDSSSSSSPPDFSQTAQRPSVIQPNIPTIIGESGVSHGANAVFDEEPRVQIERHETGLNDQVNSLSSDLGNVNVTDLLTLEGSMSLTDISFSSNVNSLPEAMDTDSLKGEGCQPMNMQIKPEKADSCGDHEMTVTVRYRNDVILQELINHPEGCRVFYGDIPHREVWYNEMFGSNEAEQLLIPHEPGTLPSDQEKWTNTVLQGMELGISIFMEKRNIYVVRRCKTRVMTALPNQEKTETMKVKRQEKLKIFDFSQDFLPAFMEYEKGEGPRPSPQVVLALGQDFFTDGEPYSDLFVSVTVCHTEARQLLDKYMMKIKEVDTSVSNEYDKCMSIMKTQEATISIHPKKLPPTEPFLKMQ